MNAEERALFIKRKLGSRWPGLNGCDNLEILIDEPELLFAIVRFGLEKEYQDQFLEMQTQLADLQRQIDDLKLSARLASENMKAVNERFSFSKLLAFMKPKESRHGKQD